LQVDNDNLVLVKICTKCGETKVVGEFGKDKYTKSGIGPHCLSCKRQAVEAWREANPEKVKAYTAKRHREKKAQANAYSLKWYYENRESTLARRKRERMDNIDASRANERMVAAKRRETPKGKLENAIRAGIHRGITSKSKAGRKTFELLGYTPEELMKHLELLFLPGMTWQNFGRGGWHIDHKIPLSAHNYETPDDVDFKRCWSLDNLQPLWEQDNLKKSAKIEGAFQPSLLIATNDNSESPQKRKKYG